MFLQISHGIYPFLSNEKTSGLLHCRPFVLHFGRNWRLLVKVILLVIITGGSLDQ